MVESLFESSVVGLGGRYDEAAYAAIPAAYQGRAYHNFDHVARVLETFQSLANGLSPQDTARCVLALIFHDAVYDPRASDNEAQSAAFARQTLVPLGIVAEDLDEIERLILVTRDHRATDPLGALVADADLAILAAPPEAYDAYAAAIRTEYAFVPDDRYRQGRSQVLQSLRARKLFTSDRLDEARAKVNLGRELAILANTPD